MPVINGKKYPYTPEGIAAAREAANNLYGPSDSNIMKARYGKAMPKYSNDPRTTQGRKLKMGGCVKSAKSLRKKR